MFRDLIYDQAGALNFWLCATKSPNPKFIWFQITHTQTFIIIIIIVIIALFAKQILKIKLKKLHKFCWCPHPQVLMEEKND